VKILDARNGDWKPLAESLLKERVEFRVINATETVVAELITLSVEHRYMLAKEVPDGHEFHLVPIPQTDHT
jgi:hypothetical protein